MASTSKTNDESDSTESFSTSNRTEGSNEMNVILGLEYETQHFGFHPRSFIDAVYNAFFDAICGALNSLKNHLIEEFNEEMSAELIETRTDDLLQDLVAKLDKAIDKLEVFLSTNVFSLPSSAVLTEDIIHVTNPVSKEDDEKLDLEILELKQKILEEKAKRAYLKSKMAEQKVVIEELTKFRSNLQHIISVAKSSGITREYLNHITSKCSELTDCIEKNKFKS